MRVLMTTDPYGGTLKYCLQLARALPEVHFLLFVLGKRAFNYEAPENLFVRHIDDALLEWDPACTLDNLSDTGDRLLKAAKEFEPDVVQLNHGAHGWLDWPCPVVHFAHACKVQWLEKMGFPVTEDNCGFYFKRKQDSFLKSNGVIFPSNSMKDDIRKNFLATDLGTVYHGRNQQDYPKGVHSRDRSALTVGRDDDLKNMRILPPNTLMVGGYNWVQDEEVASLMRKHKVYVGPSKHESFGLCPLEAALSGCALVLSDIPVFRELWGDNALYVAPDADTPKWSKAIREASERFGELGHKANAHAQRYSVAHMADGWRKIIAQIVDN